MSTSFMSWVRFNPKGQNYQEPGRAPGNPYGQSTITPDFCSWNSPAEITQTELGDFGYFGKHLIKSPGDKKCPAGLPGAWTRQKIARPDTHRPAAICDIFREHNNKTPPENMQDYQHRQKADSFEFFCARPRLDIKREEREGLGRVAGVRCRTAGQLAKFDSGKRTRPGIRPGAKILLGRIF